MGESAMLQIWADALVSFSSRKAWRISGEDQFSQSSNSPAKLVIAPDAAGKKCCFSQANSGLRVSVSR
jgi:hypothetical protein